MPDPYAGEDPEIAEYKRKHRNMRKNWELPPSFPDARVIEAYRKARVPKFTPLHLSLDSLLQNTGMCSENMYLYKTLIMQCDLYGMGRRVSMTPRIASHMGGLTLSCCAISARRSSIGALTRLMRSWSQFSRSVLLLTVAEPCCRRQGCEAPLLRPTCNALSWPSRRTA